MTRESNYIPKFTVFFPVRVLNGNLKLINHTWPINSHSLRHLSLQSRLMNQCRITPSLLLPFPRRRGCGGRSCLCRTAAGLAGLVSWLCSSVSSTLWLSFLFNGTTSPLIPACHSSAFRARALPCTRPQHNRLLSVFTHLSPSLSSSPFFPLCSTHSVLVLFRCAQTAARLQKSEIRLEAVLLTVGN